MRPPHKQTKYCVEVVHFMVYTVEFTENETICLTGDIIVSEITLREIGFWIGKQ